jgi:hypothetical protein
MKLPAMRVAGGSFLCSTQPLLRRCLRPRPQKSFIDGFARPGRTVSVRRVLATHASDRQTVLFAQKSDAKTAWHSVNYRSSLPRRADAGSTRQFMHEQKKASPAF